MLIEWEKINKRIDPEDFFPYKKKIVLEIGFGKGDFLLNYSKIFDENLIGIEISRYLILKSIKKFIKFNNIRVLNSEAFFALGHIFKKNSIDKIFIIFPDPWHKKRHEKRRLLNKEFFDRVSFVLKNEGEIFIITDEKILAEYIEENIPENFKREKSPEVYIQLANETKYGRKWRKLKKDFFDFYLIKKNDIEKYWEDILTGKRFDHLLIKNFNLSVFKEKVKKIEIKGENKFISFKNIYEGEKSFIVEFILKEETILQKAFLKGEIFKDKCILKPLNKEIIFTKGFFEIINNLS
ncbi:MAG: tRNA (guanosine(46)-N7)-methyltransferase TrmB [candidate division WOR-3 bacterium]